MAAGRTFPVRFRKTRPDRPARGLFVMRISYKLLAISEAVLLVAVLALLLPVLSQMKAQAIEQMQKELTSLALNAAPHLSGDLHRQVEAGGSGAEAAFESLRDTLLEIRRRNDIEKPDYIYTFYRDGEQVRFGVMTHPTPFTGNPYTLRIGMRQVFADGKPVATDLYTDEHGQWISAYAPITDSAGAVVGLLEVDMPAEAYFERLRMVTLLGVGVGLAALVISSLLGWRVLNALVIRPMKKIRAGATALGLHDFSHRVDLTTGDEFQDLGDTLNSISKQLNAAKIVQAGFFPRQMPDHPEYDVAGLSVPCEAAGGDYFDAFELDGGRIAILVADVSGHGLGPSLLMATCRSALRALSHENLSPGDLVDRLNNLLEDDLIDGRFITMIYGVLEPDGTFTFANAGHGPALVTSNGTSRHLEAHGPPLGVHIPLNGEPRQSTITLRPRDRVVFTSDGLSEAMNEQGVHFGVAPIERAAADRSLSSREVVERLKNEMLMHCNGPSTTDDVTILCVDRVKRVRPDRSPA